LHIAFELPEPWTCEVGDRLRVWTRPDLSIRVEVDELHELPVDRQRWGVQVLNRNLPSGGSIRQNEIMNSTNHKGWPLTLVSTAALDAGGNVVESRITLFYEFLYHGGTLAVRITRDDVERWEAELREPVMDLMMRVEPVFAGDEVAGVAELWD